MNCFSFPPSGPSVCVPPQEETQDSPSVWRSESRSCSPPYGTKSGVPTAPGGRTGVWPFPATSARQGSAPAFSSPSAHPGLLAVQSEAARSHHGPWCCSPGSPFPWAGIPSVISISCSLGGDLLLESSPVSVVRFETDFGSRLVGWGDKTALRDTSEQNACNIF